jgi:hypothetical protein
LPWLVCLEVHVGPVLPPSLEPNPVPPSPRSPAPLTPPLRADPICLEVHELPSLPQQNVYFGLSSLLPWAAGLHGIQVEYGHSMALQPRRSAAVQTPHHEVSSAFG